MKYIKTLIFSFCLITNLAFAKENILNFYGWANYIPQSVIKQFEQETGIHVNYAEYDSNETMYAKIKANPRAGYDIVIPSSYFINRMINEKMLQKLDKSKLTNLHYLNPDLMNKPFDPGNQYSVPYFWGSTGIAVNSKYHSLDSIKSWSDLWKPEYKDQLLILDDPREAFSVALITLGYSVNETNPEHIKQAYLKLKALIPNVKIFNSDAEISTYLDEDVTLGMGWSGEIYLVSKDNHNVHYVYPKDGFSIWIDNLAIPTNAPNLENAYKFINFVTRPDIAAKISIAQGYSSPNLAAVKLLPPEMRSNPAVNPNPEDLKRGQLQKDIGDARVIYEKYWEMLKTGA